MSTAIYPVLRGDEDIDWSTGIISRKGSTMDSPDFNTQWLNDLNRAAAMQQDIRMRVLNEHGYEAYTALLRASVELDMTIERQRKSISTRCQPWFEVKQ